MHTLPIESCISNSAPHNELAEEHTEMRQVWNPIIAIAIAMLTLSFTAVNAIAQVNGVGGSPYLGWSTFSEQTIVPSSTVMNEQNILAQSDAMRSSGLEAHGFRYINLDAGWSGNSDPYGRTLWNTTAFPHFLDMIQHIHANGQKIGIYLLPGIGTAVYSQNLPIFGTQYHAQDIVAQPLTIGNGFGYGYKIDFTKPGAQEYINSIITLYASWGIDFIKLDSVTPGSYNDNLNINNIPDVQAYSKAIALSGRPIWLTLSWALDEDYVSDWQQNANARRIEGDIECEGDCPNLTEWQRVLLRFYDLIGWENVSGPTLGWNDLDSLEVGNGTTDGITNTEQQTAMTLWAMANAPLSLGGDLTKLTHYGKKLLFNNEVLAVDQSGHPAKQVTGGFTPVWVSNLGNGDYYVAIFNLNAFPTKVTVDWKDLGFLSASGMRDLWSHDELRPAYQSFSSTFSSVLPGHGTRLFKVTGVGTAPAPPSQIYGAQTATLYGGAQLSACSTCASGYKLTYLGIGAANYAIFNVSVPEAGVYRMEVDSMTTGTRSFIINVNDGPDITLNLSGGSSNLPFPTTIPVRLKAGTNSIRFGNPTSYPPDMDRIIISGNGNEPYPAFSVYEAENATLSGAAATSAGFCGNCSGLAAVGNLGGNAQSTVTFDNVVVPATGTYQMEIDYMTQGQRSFFISVNGNSAQQLDLNGYSFGTPTSIVIQMPLHAGSNQIEFSNPGNYAPNLDSITISPSIDF
jgi:alpha-galactosidase